MFPVLTTDSLLGTLGKGTLTDCISCVVEEERNGAYELTLEYPQSGVHAGDIALNMLIEAKPNFTDDPQPFRIYSITKSISGTIEVHAQHISYDLGGVIVAPVKLTGATCQQAGEHLVYGTGFSFSTDKAVSNDFIINEPSSARSWLAGKSGSLLDVYGSGEFYYDGMDVKLLGQRGTNRGVEIRYGKNLSELTSESTCENMYSGVVAYYVAEDGTVTSGTEVSTGLSGITRVLALDRSDAYDTPPTTADLTTDATNYIANHNLTTPKTNITLDFVQASKLKDRVDLCDTVSIYYEAFGVSATAKCIRTKWDTLTERYTETEFGDPKNNITDTIIEVEKKAEEAVSETTMQHAINEATNQITGNNGGYVVLHDANSDGEPDEILIMDSPDISTAVDLWRWNNGGLGFSSTGYSGQYGIAITSTGAIVADFITAGTLNANVIRAGILQDAQGYNSWNLQTGAFTITNGSINILTTAETYDQIALRWNDGGSNNVWTSLYSGGLSVRDYNNANKRWYQINRYGIFEYQEGTGGSVSWPISAIDNASLVLGTNSAGALSDGVSIGGRILLYSANGVLRQTLNGDGQLRQYGTNGTTRTFLDYGDIYLYTGAGDETIQISSNNFSNGGVIRFRDASARERSRHTIDGVTFYNTSGTTIANYPATHPAPVDKANLTAVSSRGEVLGGYAYQIGNAVLISFHFRASATATNSPGIADVSLLPDQDCALNCIDITNGIETAIEASVPCGVRYNGKIYLKTITAGHIYAITGVYPIYAA